MTTLIEATARAIDPEIWSDTFLDVGRMNRVRQESLDRAQDALTALQESGYVVVKEERIRFVLDEFARHADAAEKQMDAALKAAQEEG